MKGMRKVWMLLALSAVIAVLPILTGADFTTGQVDLFTTLIVVAFSGNAVEHIAEGVKYAATVRSARRAGNAVRPVTDPESAPAEGKH